MVNLLGKNKHIDVRRYIMNICHIHIILNADSMHGDDNGTYVYFNCKFQITTKLNKAIMNSLSDREVKRTRSHLNYCNLRHLFQLVHHIFPHTPDHWPNLIQ